MGRTLVASLLPALVVGAAWLALEDPRRVGEALAVAALALLPALVPAGARRIGAAAVATVGAAFVYGSRRESISRSIRAASSGRSGGTATTL